MRTFFLILFLIGYYGTVGSTLLLCSNWVAHQIKPSIHFHEGLFWFVGAFLLLWITGSYVIIAKMGGFK